MNARAICEFPAGKPGQSEASELTGSPGRGPVEANANQAARPQGNAAPSAPGVLQAGTAPVPGTVNDQTQVKRSDVYLEAWVAAVDEYRERKAA